MSACGGREGHSATSQSGTRWSLSIRVEVEPELRRLPAQLVSIHLQDAVAEFFHRQARLVRHHVQHGLAQVGIALAHHLVHPYRGHACVLQQGEGLAGLHGS